MFPLFNKQLGEFIKSNDINIQIAMKKFSNIQIIKEKKRKEKKRKEKKCLRTYGAILVKVEDKNIHLILPEK